MRLIDADSLKTRAIRVSTVKGHCYMKAVGTHEIDKAPTIDAVPLEVWKQTAWERDIAIQQLEEHGIAFGGIAPDVVKVVRCKDCRRAWICGKKQWFGENGYCSNGERKDAT